MMHAGSQRQAHLIASGMAGLFASLAFAQPQLVYRFTPQTVLVFREDVADTPGTTTAPARPEAEIRLWLLQQTGAALLALLEVAPAQAADSDAAIFWLDAQGRRDVPAGAAGAEHDLAPYLDALPVLPVGAQLESQWRTPPDGLGRFHDCINRGPDAAQGGLLRVDFAVADTFGLDALQPQRRGTFWFDVQRGLVRRVERTVPRPDSAAATTQDAGKRTRIVLHEVRALSPAWCTRRAAEAARYLQTLEHDARLAQLVLERPGELDALQRQREELWLGFAAEVERGVQSPFAAVAKGRHQRAVAMRDVLAARAALARRWLNQKAPGWTLQTSDGATVTAEALRDRVTVEVFWSSAQRAGVRAVALLGAQPPPLDPRVVRLVGYNLDRDFGAAQAAIKCCGAGITHVLAAPLTYAEPLQELPIVRVLDQRGVVRGIWIGWQADYAAPVELARTLVRQAAP